MTLLSIVYRSSIPSSPFLLIAPFQLSSCLPGQHHTEPPLPVARSSILTTVDEHHPQPSKHWRCRKRWKSQKQRQEIGGEMAADSYFGDLRHIHSGTWKHGLHSDAQVVWEEYDEPTGYFDKEYDCHNHKIMLSSTPDLHSHIHQLWSTFAQVAVWTLQTSLYILLHSIPCTFDTSVLGSLLSFHCSCVQLWTQLQLYFSSVSAFVHI